MKAVFSAKNTVDYGSAPQYLVVTVTEELLSHIESLQALCVNGINSISATIDGEWTWESEEVQTELRLYGDELVVHQFGFWFQTNIKHQDNGHVEAKQIELRALRDDFNAGKELVFYGDDASYLQAIYEEAQLASAEL
ncbi:hypothetical protein [Aquipseudomonas alcaligenes]|uniref:Uncharacterized protein n=1 Tax=Aquipseudomonas alcaligenes TaxID=43263 RepID=A0A1N6XD73_AQUAC|nr:hypothetical protein [Pseudomonas alcaligenes]SIR00308.1 hypothetical protein SAMN05878282_11293 [Pseudomonas alcaligenes]